MNLYLIGKKYKVSERLYINILEDCGYSIDDEKLHIKNNNLILINLISPRIDYNSHSKSNIELKPFAQNVSMIFYNFCKYASYITRNKNNGNDSRKY